MAQPPLSKWNQIMRLSANDLKQIAEALQHLRAVTNARVEGLTLGRIRIKLERVDDQREGLEYFVTDIEMDN